MPTNASTAKGFGAFFLNEDFTSLTFTTTVAGLDFTGSQTADPGDDLVAAHIHAPGARGTNAGVRFGFFGQPFNDTNPNDVVVTPFADGVGGTITSKWDLTEGNNTTLAQQLPSILAGLSYINFHTTRFPGGEIRGQIEENPEVTDNLRKVFSYGHRNGFGMAFDPVKGSLWMQENGDDSFSELNRIEPGMNGGWVQIMGPLARIAQFKEIETSAEFFGLQQVRWSPENIADTPAEALESLFVVPGSHYSDPEFSWKFEVAPGGIGFLESSALGGQYRNDLFIGAATPALEGGYLFHFDLTGNRRNIDVDDRRLRDRVADNLGKHEITESESLLFGTGFGVVTDIQTGPNGNLYVVSLSDGAVYEISKAVKHRNLNFATRLTGDNEVPARETRAEGLATFRVNGDGTELRFLLAASRTQQRGRGAHPHWARECQRAGGGLPVPPGRPRSRAVRWPPGQGDDHGGGPGRPAGGPAAVGPHRRDGGRQRLRQRPHRRRRRAARYRAGRLPRRRDPRPDPAARAQPL